MPMANWMTAAEISARYVVGEQKLLAYAQRGNLPLMRQDGGATLFDESVVALYFRPRNAAAAQALPPNVRGLGVLGVSRLGDPAPAQPSASPVTPIQRGGATPKPPRV